MFWMLCRKWCRTAPSQAHDPLAKLGNIRHLKRGVKPMHTFMLDGLALCIWRYGQVPSQLAAVGWRCIQALQAGNEGRRRSPEADRSYLVASLGLLPNAYRETRRGRSNLKGRVCKGVLGCE